MEATENAVDKVGRVRDLALARTDIYTFDPRTIVVQKDWNGRDFSDPANARHVEEVALSMRTVGQKNPITIRRVKVDGVEQSAIVDGETRLRAALLNIERGHWTMSTDGGEYKGIVCQIETRGANDVDLLVNQMVRNGAKNFTPLETASRIARLLTMGQTEQELADKLGKPLSFIEEMIGLAEMPQVVKQAVVEKKIGAYVAVRAIKTHGEQEVTEVVKANKAKGTRTVEAEFEARGGHAPTKNYKKTDAIAMVKTFKGMLETLQATDMDDKEKVEVVERYVVNVLENYGELAD